VGGVEAQQRDFVIASGQAAEEDNATRSVVIRRAEVEHLGKRRDAGRANSSCTAPSRTTPLRGT